MRAGMRWRATQEKSGPRPYPRFALSIGLTSPHFPRCRDSRFTNARLNSLGSERNAMVGQMWTVSVTRSMQTCHDCYRRHCDTCFVTALGLRVFRLIMRVPAKFDDPESLRSDEKTFKRTLEYFGPGLRVPLTKGTQRAQFSPRIRHSDSRQHGGLTYSGRSPNEPDLLLAGPGRLQQHDRGEDQCSTTRCNPAHETHLGTFCSE